MRISFQKQAGQPDLGIAFYWMMKIDVNTAVTISDTLIPELFYDYLFVHTGKIDLLHTEANTTTPLSRQALKTLHTRPINLSLTLPLILFGARLTLQFAESFWGESLPPNSFLPKNWVDTAVADLNSFATQVTTTIEACRTKKTAESLLTPTLDETAWLAQYSARHKRRLYKRIFGLSRKEIQAIQNVHTFLEQACDFTEQNPRIIEHVNDDVFYDQPHLNHAFKKVTGFSPLEYFQASSILQDNLMAVSYNATLD